MNFKYNKELNGWFLTTDDGFIAYYDFNEHKYSFCGRIVDLEGRKYFADANTKRISFENNTTYTEEKLVD